MTQERHGSSDARAARQQRCERATAPASQVRVARQQRYESAMLAGPVQQQQGAKGRTPQPQRGERGTAAAMRERHSSSDASAPQHQLAKQESQGSSDARAPCTAAARGELRGERRSRSEAREARQQRCESAMHRMQQPSESGTAAVMRSRAPQRQQQQQQRYELARVPQQQRCESATTAGMQERHNSS